jgi:hypothetical protein
VRLYRDNTCLDWIGTDPSGLGGDLHGGTLISPNAWETPCRRKLYQACAVYNYGTYAGLGSVTSPLP